MRIAVFGLGYVGTVAIACLAQQGHDLVAVDIEPLKVDMIDRGQSPIVEPRVPDLLTEAKSRGRLTATLDAEEAVRRSEVSLICVGTPSQDNGAPDLRHLQNCIQSIGHALKSINGYYVVAVRSTIPPGTTEDIVIPALEAASGKTVGDDIGVCFNPEFLREGVAVSDFINPPYTIIGSDDSKARKSLADIYAGIDAPVVFTSPRVAEMVKYSNNAFHALKITFANEFGRLCKAFGMDSHDVMNLVKQDTQLNISPAYLDPGYAFGGSCLPKDLRALQYMSRQFNVKIPLLESILPSNEIQTKLGVDMILAQPSKKIGILGLSFKAGTDDLRESPVIILVETLLGKGYQVKLYDPKVSWAYLIGANRRFLENTIPHVASLISDSLDDVIAESDVLVIGNRSPEFAKVFEQAGEKRIIDLVRLVDDPKKLVDGFYQGISW